jgi:hypothetical protein
VILDGAQDQVGRTKQCVDGPAVRALDRRRKRKEGAEEDRIAVDYEKRSDAGT